MRSLLFIIFMACGSTAANSPDAARPDAANHDGAVADGSSPDGSPDAMPVETCNPGCTGNDICINDSCVAAFPRSYTITVVSGTAASTNDGDPWDTMSALDGAEPDLYIDVYLGVDLLLHETEVRSDSFSETWNESFDVTLTVSSGLSLYLTDSDPGVGELVVKCEYLPITAAVLRSGQLGCSSANGSIAATIVP